MLEGMKELMIYMLETMACNAVLMLFYGFLLDRRVSFATCRIYLLAAMVAAAVIPLLRIPVWHAAPMALAVGVTAGEISADVVADAGGIGMRGAVLAVYAVGVALSLAVMAAQLYRIGSMARSGEVLRGHAPRIVRTAERIASFSFFGTIYMSRDIAEADMAAIVAHESSHIRHRHSAEKVAMQLLRALMWWNPFVWIAQRRLSEVHEYEADADVLDEGYDVNDYIASILKSLLGYSPDIANSFRDSLTKKRLKMMITKRKSRYALLRTLAVLPVLAALLCTFSFTARAEQTEVPVSEIGTAVPAAETTQPQDPQKKEVLMRAEVMPKFNGGDIQDFRMWMMSQIHYPKSMYDANIQGTMLVEFVINREGKLTDIRIINELHKDASKLVADILSKSPLWSPGMNDGKAVDIKFMMPLNFRLSDGSASGAKVAAAASREG